jgi:hypothetical protein
MVKPLFTGEPINAQPVAPGCAYCCTLTLPVISAPALIEPILAEEVAPDFKVKLLLALNVPFFNHKVPLTFEGEAKTTPFELLIVKS